MSGKLFQKDIIPTQKIESNLAIKVQQDIIDKILSVYPTICCLKLGSVGKKNGYNNDIDIGVQTKDINELSKIIHKVFDYTDTVENKTLFIISIKYPYEDENIIKYVAVDFILVNDIEYSKFRYYCPDYRKNESKYKVGLKIMFIGTILNHCKKNIQLENIHIKLMFDPTGLFADCYTNDGKFRRELITTSPQDIIDIMFYDSKPEICNTVENIWDAIHSNKFKYPEEVKNLELAFFVNSYRKGLYDTIKPEDFYIQYWNINELNDILKTHIQLSKFNKFIDENYY